jgi:hypothetical protein
MELMNMVATETKIKQTAHRTKVTTTDDTRINQCKESPK